MTIWRRRLVRGMVLAAVGGAVCAAAVAYQLTGNAAVQQHVTSQLRKFFVGGDVALGSAKFRLLGGVSVENFTLYRLDDPDRTPLLHVPSGIIYHDKEALAHGRLAVRKLKLDRPQLTISRAADGRWNVGGILGPVHPEFQIPVIEIEQGTVLIEIATGTASPFRVELRNVNATLVNQPLPVLTIQVHGEAVALGPFHANATWHRTEPRLDATADLAPIPVTTALLRELACFYPALAEQVQQASGVGRLHAGVQYHDNRWRHQARLDISAGRLVHRDLPLPLDGIELAGRCDDGAVAIERFTAKAGSADVALSCRFMPDPSSLVTRPLSTGEESTAVGQGQVTKTLVPACLNPVQTLEMTVKHLPVGPALFAKLPAAFQKYDRFYAPTGPLDFTLKVDRTAGPWTLKAKLRPDGMAGKFESFPYPIHGVHGSLDVAMGGDRPPRLDVDLTAEANGRRPVTIQGNVEGDSPTPAYAMTVSGDAIALDDSLVLALPEKFRGVVAAYHPRGRCDITAQLIRGTGETQAHQRFTVGCRGDVAVCYDLFPVPLERLAGSLDIALEPNPNPIGPMNWVCSFNDIRAGYAGARITIGGQARPTADGTRVDLTIAGRNVPLDETLAAAFASPRMKLRPIWEMFRPTGRFAFTAKVAHTDHHLAPTEYDIHVEHAGATVRPTFFPLEIADLNGAFRLTPGRVEVGRFTAKHGPTRLDFGGGTVRFGEGWHEADLRGLHADALPVDTALVAALPGALQSVFHALQPTGILTVDLDHLVIVHPPEFPGPPQPPVIYWNGRVNFTDAALHTGVAWTGVTGVIASEGRYRGQLLDGVNGKIILDRATVFNQPLAGMTADAWVPQERPHELSLRLGRGQLFGGQLLGEAHVAFGAGLQYEVNLKAVDVQLDEAAKHNHVGGNSQMSGLAMAELYLTGTGYGMDELGGGGAIHVPNGKMYNLPLALDLLKVVTDLHAPDRTAFEEAHVEFKIHGKRIEVKRLDLLGSAVSLGGKGEMDIDGSNLAMNFYAVWGHIAQLLPPGLRDVPPWLSKNLLLIKATGKLGGPLVVRPEFVPMMVDPVRQLVDKARKAAGQAPGVRAQKD